jgi:hypothetical protein
MDLEHFRSTLSKPTPPDGIDPRLLVLWLDADGQWDRAHDLAQELPDPDGAWLHAYLHRVEGDLANAGYWYRRAGKPVSSATLEGEWEELARQFSAH